MKLPSTKYELPIEYFHNGKVVYLGKIVVVRYGVRVGVFRPGVPEWLKDSLFVDEGLTKIIIDAEETPVDELS